MSTYDIEMSPWYKKKKKKDKIVLYSLKKRPPSSVVTCQSCYIDYKTIRKAIQWLFQLSLELAMNKAIFLQNKQQQVLNNFSKTWFWNKKALLWLKTVDKSTIFNRDISLFWEHMPDTFIFFSKWGFSGVIKIKMSICMENWY